VHAFTAWSLTAPLLVAGVAAVVRIPLRRLAARLHRP
jgi:hypothetical protein